jgi:hypothetical protein
VSDDYWETQPVSIPSLTGSFLPGQLLIFGSYLAHRSGANTSKSHRNAIYATYNCAKEGDLRHDYYVDRKKLWPATHMRKEGEEYSEGALRYGFGSPMLTVQKEGSKPIRA